jgi:hypothetical protein
MALSVTPGDQFGRLTVLSQACRDKHGYLMYGCICTCGRTKVVRSTLLVHGQTRSCGCLRREETAARHRLSRGVLVHTPLPGASAPSACAPIRRSSRPRRRSYTYELENWPLRSRIVFRMLRHGERRNRREIEAVTLLTCDAVAEALEHLMRIGEVTEERGPRGYIYTRSLESLAVL